MSAVRKKPKPDPIPEPESDETRDIFELIEEVVPGWAEWIDAPNLRLALKTPRQAIQDGEEKWVRNIVLSFSYGMFS